MLLNLSKMILYFILLTVSGSSWSKGSDTLTDFLKGNKGFAASQEHIIIVNSLKEPAFIQIPKSSESELSKFHSNNEQKLKLVMNYLSPRPLSFENSSSKAKKARGIGIESSKKTVRSKRPPIVYEDEYHKSLLLKEREMNILELDMKRRHEMEEKKLQLMEKELDLKQKNQCFQQNLLKLIFILNESILKGIYPKDKTEISTNC